MIEHDVNINLKVHPRTGCEGPEGEYKYRFTFSLTSTLQGGGWSTPRPGLFTSGKETRYPLYRRLGGPHCRSGRVLKMSPATAIRSPDRPARGESHYINVRIAYRFDNRTAGD